MYVVNIKLLLDFEAKFVRVEGFPCTVGIALNEVLGGHRTSSKTLAPFRTIYATLTTAINAKGITKITKTVTVNKPKTIF